MQYDQHGALLYSQIPGLGEPRRGKVRDIYDCGEHLLIVASDRISAFDVVMPNGIPDKGRILTHMSCFWFAFLDWMPNHLRSVDVTTFPAAAQACAEDLRGRAMLVDKATIIPVECVARGYLAGSGWQEYQRYGTVCGIELPPGYQQGDRLEQPIFTPARKAEQGEHDENIAYADVVDMVGAETAATLRRLTLELYSAAAAYAAERGLIIADTKFEFGHRDGTLTLCDEVLTCDSSRFWPAEAYQVGGSPPSLDKQFVRDYLERIAFNKQPPAPELPAEVVQHTREKYLQALRQLLPEDQQLPL